MRRAAFLLLSAILAAAALAACATSTVRVPETVKVPVAIPCLRAEDRPQKPAMRAESDLLAMDTYRRTLAAWSDLKKLEAYSAELEALVEGCSRIPAGRPP